jgi:hypothetical protein
MTTNLDETKMPTELLQVGSWISDQELNELKEENYGSLTSKGDGQESSQTTAQGTVEMCGVYKPRIL